MYVQLLEAQERVTPQWNNRQSMHRYGATDFTPGGSQIQDISGLANHRKSRPLSAVVQKRTNAGAVGLSALCQ